MTVCDRCESKEKVDFFRLDFLGKLNQGDLCLVCQTKLKNIYDIFMLGANLEDFGTKFYKENYNLKP